MNYRNFLLIAERYYEPTEKLPSGRSPMQKFFSKSERLRRKGNIEQSNRLEGKFGKVKRGADNPELDTSSHPDLEIKKLNPRSTTFYHKPTGIAYNIIKTDYKGTPVHSISWGHAHNPTTDKERRRIAYDAKKMYRRDIEPRLGHGTIVHNSPMSDKHKEIYWRFGYEGSGDQYGKVGRMPSPRQGSNKNRVKPFKF